jgi:hypothetical protein
MREISTLPEAHQMDVLTFARPKLTGIWIR